MLAFSLSSCIIVFWLFQAFVVCLLSCYFFVAVAVLVNNRHFLLLRFCVEFHFVLCSLCFIVPRPYHISMTLFRQYFDDNISCRPKILRYLDSLGVFFLKNKYMILLGLDHNVVPKMVVPCDFRNITKWHRFGLQNVNTHCLTGHHISLGFASHSTQKRSFWRRTFQPISWLVLKRLVSTLHLLRL